MLGSGRGILAALAGLAALFTALFTGAYYGSVYAPEKRHYQSVGPNSGQAYPADSPRNGLADVAGIDRFTESLIAKPQPRSTNEREQRDLAAQESMAVFGYWVFWAMMLQTALAGGALIALVKDLRQSRRSAENQLRAYISMEVTAGTIFEAGKEVQIQLHAKNYGQTPARNCELRFATAFNPATWVWEHTMNDARPYSASITIHPGVPHLTAIQPVGILSEEMLDQIQAGLAAFFARGVLFYEDVFGREHYTQLSIEIRDQEIGTTKVRISPNGNIAT